MWEPTPSTEPEVSIAEDIRGLQGMDLGGTVTMDVIGRKLTARITSVRRLDWRNSRTAFLMLFRPGSLESAPTMYVGGLNVQGDDDARSRFQRLVLDKYPNVTIIDVAEIVRSVARLLNNVTLAVSFIGAFVLLSGVLILIGSIAMTRYQRIYESAILKTLGAKRKLLLAMMLAEYGVLGLIAGVTGSIAGAILSYAASRFILDIPWTLTVNVNLIGIAATLAMVTIVGTLASLDVLTRKPLGILRSA
jgi:putative ABC transport system permease protein